MTLIAFNCLYSRFLPESIRWLISKKKYCQARELIIKASKMNGVPVPEHLIVIPDNDKESVIQKVRMLTIRKTSKRRNRRLLSTFSVVQFFASGYA